MTGTPILSQCKCRVRVLVDAWKAAVGAAVGEAAAAVEGLRDARKVSSLYSALMFPYC
jgi:hypothetical protein